MLTILIIFKDMDNNTKNKKKQKREYWKAEEEIIIQQWADKAQCYQWMHARCREIYQNKNAWYTIPVIIISTITGTANFAQDRFSDNVKEYVVMGIGSMSIIAGIITTIYQFLKISELNEGHRAASISWGKFYNNLKTIGLRHPLDRHSPNETIKIYQDEYDRLLEISPSILPIILKKFNNQFKKNDDLIKPSIGNTLDPTPVFKMSDDERQTMIDSINNISTNKKLVNTFFSLNGRSPSERELESITESTNINMEIDSNNSINSDGSIQSDESNQSDGASGNITTNINL
jgi:hypothetical protein